MSDLTERVISACQILKSKDAEFYAPVIRLLMATEQQERRGTRKGKRVVMLANVKGKSGKFFIDSDFLKGDSNE